MLQCGHLIENTAKCPEVRLVVVRLVLTDLWAEVVGSAYAGFCIINRALQYPGNAKVPKFNIELAGDEYVLCLDISVQNMAAMDILESKADLKENVENEFFLKYIYGCDYDIDN